MTSTTTAQQTAAPGLSAIRASAVSGAWPAVRAVLLGILGLVAVAGLWEGYKAVAPEKGVLIGKTRVLPRSSDLTMPHVWDIVKRLGEPVTSLPGAEPLWRVVMDAVVVSLKIAAAGWLIGTVIGLLLALLMARLKVAEWGLLPWIVLSQTVPLIAFAPMVRSWGAKFTIGSWQWEPWMSVALIASYLAFFPVAVGALRGLQASQRIHTELMHTYNAGWWSTLRRVRLPAAVPYLLPALRLGAAGAVVGTVVAEVSIAYPDGIGRMIITYAGQASGDPAKAYAPILGAIALGLIAGGFVALLGLTMRTYRRGEAS
ncbi:ABC transporter permease [Nocardioides sp. GXZ039]|uniref:ABC transporter permease n=1 Tax=Nocardioides sp. GXZ039 TaxID=3136018 RepID=UPI0030F48054